MENYINSSTWKRTLGVQDENVSMLMQSFKNTREKAAHLAREIARIMPQYTSHDIAHIDALWESADIILPRDYKINPVEAYVLGIAFLIHDLGMGLTAYVKGLNEIKETSLWKDIVATELKKRGKNTGKNELGMIDEEIQTIATEYTLRKLHAEQAAKLLMLEWEYEGKKEYLIDEVRLREAYGEIIGQIAYSHWWSIEQLKEAFFEKQRGALSCFPSEWTVDVLKLACILRIVDAIQIDDRRAPMFLMKLRKPVDISRVHWVFQSKLYKPIVRNERIEYTSKSAFEVEEMEAWWTCYDTLKMIDDELSNVDTLLIDTGHEKLNASGVRGITSTKDLADFIGTNGWTPIDTSIRVGDVGKLVRNLGGRQLYGDNLLVPIRELIQNGADAIRARAIIEEDEEYAGNIIISFQNKEDDLYVCFEDNGIGMNQRVLIGPFLDFGQSFWGTEMMYEELPGLSYKGFDSTGQYGIGFYSVFMWSSSIIVITRRYDAAREDTLVLEFNKGTMSRPILRKASKAEQIKNGGTKVIIKVSDELIKQIIETNHVPELLGDTIAKLCPCLDCNLWIKEEEKQLIVSANDWLTMKPMSLLKRIIGPNAFVKIPPKTMEFLQNMSQNMEIIKDENKIYGRAFICVLDYYGDLLGRVSIGGFATTRMYGICGILIGESVRATRDVSVPLIGRSMLQDWTMDQVRLILKREISPKKQMFFSEIISSLGIKPFELYIAEWRNGFLKYQDIIDKVRNETFEEYIIVSGSSMTTASRGLPTDFRIEYQDNILWCDREYVSILQSGGHSTWPFDNWEEWKKFMVEELVIEAVLCAWEINEIEREKYVIKSDEENVCSAVIGIIEGREWKIDYVIKVSRAENSI